MSDHDPSSPLETLVANHRRFLLFLERRVGSREEAEEILQDAFVRGAERAWTIRDEESTVAWFFRLLRNAVADHHRRRTREQRILDRLIDESDPEPDSELLGEVCACIRGLVSVLSPDYAELIRRVDLGGEAIGSIATERGVSGGSARVRLHRARAALRREVERTCRTCAEHGCLDCRCRSAADP